MSRLGTTRTPSASGPVLGLSIDLTETLSALGSLPPVVKAAVTARAWDAVKHHRNSVLAHHGLPNRRGGQKLLAQVIHRYARPQSLEGFAPSGIIAENFAAASGEQFSNGELRDFEYGRTINSSSWMVIPAGKGLRRTARGNVAVPELRTLIKERRLILIPGPRGPSLVRPVRFVSALRGQRRGQLAKGARFELFAVLRKRRTQRPLLGYFKQWESVRPRQEAKLEQDLALALDVTDHVRLAEVVLSAGLRGKTESGSIRGVAQINSAVDRRLASLGNLARDPAVIAAAGRVRARLTKFAASETLPPRGGSKGGRR